jgi:hypothetical protein
VIAPRALVCRACAVAATACDSAETLAWSGCHLVPPSHRERRQAGGGPDRFSGWRAAVDEHMALPKPRFFLQSHLMGAAMVV